MDKCYYDPLPPHQIGIRIAKHVYRCSADVQESSAYPWFTLLVDSIFMTSTCGQGTYLGMISSTEMSARVGGVPFAIDFERCEHPLTLVSTPVQDVEDSAEDSVDCPDVKKRVPRYLRDCCACGGKREEPKFITFDLTDYPICGICSKYYMNKEGTGIMRIKDTPLDGTGCTWCSSIDSIPTHQSYVVGNVRFDLCSLCWEGFRIGFFEKRR